MSDEANESFDQDKLRQLVELMEKHDLREVKLEGGAQKWLLRRGQQAAPMPMFAPAPYPQQALAPPPAPIASAAAPPAASGTASAADEGLVDIKSPTVGTFYQSPAPGEPAFVKVGDRVTAEKVVCVIEAMKVFNQIPAKVSGTIVRALVNDGDAVEFGQALFKVKPE